MKSNPPSDNYAEVASAPCQGVLRQPPVTTLVIGCKTNRAGQPISGRYWQGRIDELAIFNSALSAETIKRLYRGIGLSSPRSAGALTPVQALQVSGQDNVNGTDETFVPPHQKNDQKEGLPMKQ